jgi:hypothetical protein
MGVTVGATRRQQAAKLSHRTGLKKLATFARLCTVPFAIPPHLRYVRAPCPCGPAGAQSPTYKCYNDANDVPRDIDIRTSTWDFDLQTISLCPFVLQGPK